MQWGRAFGLAARATVARRSSAAAPPHLSRTRRTAARPTKPPRWAFLAIATHVNGFRKLIHVDKKLPLGLEENKRSKLISTFPIMFYISHLFFFFLELQDVRWTGKVAVKIKAFSETKSQFAIVLQSQSPWSE